MTWTEPRHVLAVWQGRIYPDTPEGARQLAEDLHKAGLDQVPEFNIVSFSTGLTV